MSDSLSHHYFKVVKTGFQYASTAFVTEKKKYRRKQIFKTLLYTIVHHQTARKWFEILASNNMQSVVQKRPRLYMKPFRPYISSKWNKKRVINVILDSYDFIRQKQLTQIIDQENFILANFNMKDDVAARILICYDEKLRKEGEFVIKFVCEQLGGVISMSSISFEQDKGEWICRIGCIQGNHLLPPESTKQAQLMMHGLRPKVLMIFCIQTICQHFGITGIFGAGDQILAHNKKHAIHIPWIHKLKFSYDLIWKEEGGELGDDGFYSIPCIPKRKSIEEMKVHKRAYYRRRYELENEISNQIKQSLS